MMQRSLQLINRCLARSSVSGWRPACAVDFVSNSSHVGRSNYCSGVQVDEKHSQAAIFRQQTYTAFRNVVEPFVLKFEDTQSSFQKKSSFELMQAVFILRLCTLEPLVKFAPALIQASIHAKLDALVFWVIKQTFFKHFCAGEDLEEVRPVIAKLHDASIGSILDYSAEGAVGTDEDLDISADRIMETILLGQEYDSIRFACLKVSALADARLLERLSDECLKLGGFEKINEAMENLNEEDKMALELVLARLTRLSAQAEEQKMPLLVDAEQTWLQPAIDGIVLNLSRAHNRSDPIVYNTFQMYLKDSRGRLEKYMALADEEGHVPCAKLVRGAYMQSEGERCKENGQPYPVHDTIEDTHQCYDDAVTVMINRLDTCGVLVASHNQTTVEKAVEALLDKGHPADHPNLAFGQLYGMADHLSFALGSNKFNICKYVPFGPIREVIPYLIRRLEENASILGGTPYERSLLWKELKRRRIRISFDHS